MKTIRIEGGILANGEVNLGICRVVFQRQSNLSHLRGVDGKDTKAPSEERVFIYCSSIILLPDVVQLNDLLLF
jgi:hypothetical protein